MKKFTRFVPFSKIDEAKREVYGLVTSEAVDSDGQVCDYKSTKPLYEKWSAGFAKATDGKSLGNVREMHDNIAAGKVIGLDFDDKSKKISASVKVVDDSSWKKVQEGVLTGFSHGGVYSGDPWKDDDGHERYTADPREISLVDLPANPEALFEHVKLDGSVEMCKFADLSKKKKTKRVAGKDLGPESFAYVGDAEDTSTWKLPIHDASHVRNALARFNQTKGIPEGEKEKVHARIVAAAKKFGIDVSEKASKAINDFASKHMAKSLYDVSRFAEILQSLYYLAMCSESERDYEGDDSSVPDELREHIEELCGTFEEMSTEEVKELIETLTAAGGAKELYMIDNKTDLAKAAAHSLAAHFKKSASHHEKMHKSHAALAEAHGQLADHEDKGMAKAHKSMADHHGKLAGLHKSHAEHLHKMSQACSDNEDQAKAAQAEIIKSAEGIEPEKQEPVAAISDADIQKRIDEAVKPFADTIEKLNASLTKALGEPEPAKVAKTETAAVTKEQDGNKAATEKKEEPAKPVIVTRADQMVDVLKSAKAVPNASIPSR